MEELEYGINQLHKKQKTNKAQEQYRKEKKIKKEIAIVIGMMIIAVITICVFNTLVTKANTRTTEELVEVARCVDYGECK